MLLGYKATDIPETDYELYFGGTMVRVHQPNEEPHWMMFHSSQGKGLTFINHEGKTIILTRNKNLILEQTFPFGFFNTKESVVFGERIPVREVKKGINNRNYRLRSMEKVVVDALETDNIKIETALASLQLKRKIKSSAEFFESTFGNPKYFSLNESYIAIKGKKVFARALSHEYAIVPHPHSKDFLIFRFDRIVAELVSKNKLKILSECFRQECLNFFEGKVEKII